MAYKLTAADRRAQAALLRAEREARYKKSLPLAKRVAATGTQKKNEAGTGVKVLHTVGDVGANFVTGAAKGLEGIYDLGAGLVGAVGGLFSDKFEDDVKAHIAKDHVGEWFGNAWQEGLDQSALNDSTVGGIIEGVAQGVGQMLPAVAVSLIPGVGPALGAKLALGTTIASAAGTGTEQAFQDGAGYGQGLAYGAASGAIEGVTEKLLPGAGDLYGKAITKMGKSAAKEIGQEVAEVGIKRVAKEALGEGAEEVLAELANPALKSIYKGKDALEEYGDSEYWKGVAEAGVVGMGTSIAYGGTVGRVTKTTGQHADARATLEHIDTMESRIADGDLSIEQEVQARENIKADYEQLSKRLAKASEKTRADVLKNPQLAAAFDADGTIKAEFSAQLDNSIKAAGDTSHGFNREYYSATARGREAEIAEGLAREGTKIYGGTLTDAEGENLNRLRKAHAALSRKGLVGTDFVLSEESPKFNSYLDGKTVVIGKDTLTDGTYIQKLVHEVEHFAEGTKEWAELASFVFDNSAETNAAIDTVVNSGYGITEQDIATLGEGLKNGNLTKGQRTLISEVVALRSEVLFGSEQTIMNLTRENRTLAAKILDRIKQFLEVFKAKTPEEKAEVKRLQEAQRLFERALGNAGAKYAAEKLTRINAESMQVGGEIESTPTESGESAVQYSKKITAGMSEKERAAILREQRISPCEIVVAEGFDIDFELLEHNRKSAVEQPLIKKMRQLGALRTYKTDAVDIEFEFTRRGLTKSMHSQVSDYGGNLADFAKVVMNMQQLLDAAVLLEIHTDKANGTLRENVRLIQTYVLLSAYKEKNTVTPVQFEIKQYVGDDNRLYLAVALTKIEIGVMDDTALQTEMRTRLLPISTISIPELVQKINPQDENFFKYIPDEFLTDRQIQAKRRALTREAKKYGREVPQFSLKPTQNARTYANRNQEKAYTKNDARKVLTAALREQLVFGDEDMYAAMYGKRREGAVEQIFNALNTLEPGRRAGAALDIADYIIDNAVVESMDFADTEEAMKRLQVLRGYLHKLDLSSVSQHFADKYGKQWRARKGTDGIALEKAASDLREQGVEIKADTADNIFVAIHDAYNDARSAAIKELRTKLGEVMGEDERNQRRQDIAKEILRGFDYTGEDSKLAREMARFDVEKDSLHKSYQERLAAEREQAKAENDALRAENRERLAKKEERFQEMRRAFREERRKLRERFEQWQEREAQLDSMDAFAKKLDNVEKGRFFSATIYRGANATLKKIPMLLRMALTTKRAFTGSIRNTLSDVKEWYCATDNKMLYKVTPETPIESMADGQVVFDKDIAAMLEELTTGKGELTLAELKMVNMVAQHFLTVSERYQRVFIDGKWVDGEKLAISMVDTARQAREDQNWLVHGLVSKYMRQFGDPATLFRAMDGYDPNGFYTTVHKWMREAAISMQVDELHALKDYYEWHKKHKKWAKHLEHDVIEFRGEKMTVGQLMTLYCNAKTEKSKQGLADNGYKFTDKDGKPHRVKGLIYEQAQGANSSEKHERADVQRACKSVEDAIWDLLNAEQREYVKMLESVLNTVCRKWKIDTDTLLKGFTLVQEQGYYFPSAHNGIAKTVDTTFYEGDRVGHLSLNKNAVEGARGELVIENIDDVVLRHVHNMSLYKNYAIVAENRSILQNIDVGVVDGTGKRVKNVHQAVTIRTAMEEHSKNRGTDVMKLLDKMSNDLQGGRRAGQDEQSFLKDLVEQIRGNYARFQLGFNPKTLATQLSSLIAAGNVLEYNCIVRGIKGFGSKQTAQLVDKYCPLAELRNFDNSAALAAGVLETTGKIGDVLMKGIGFVDRRVVCSLFYACQLQVEKNGGAKVGTEENLKAAGELLTRVILETQQNSLVTEKSDAMRGGIFSRTFTMFTADGMKVIGRWFDALGEWAVIKRRLKNAKADADKSRLQKELKRVHGKVARSTSALVGQAVYMALISYAFRLLYDKDEEQVKDNVLQGVWDFAGGLIGGLPIVRDVYSYFTDGYELDNFFLSTINDVLVATKNSFDVATDALSGKDVSRQDVFGSVRKVTYAAGQMFGIPVRNAYNFATGLTRRFVPTVGYTVDSLFASKAYSTDLAKAIESEDEHMVETITGLMIDENIGIEDEKMREVVKKLAGEGYSVLPRSVGDTVTLNGEERTLTGKQQKRFRTVYAVGEEAVANMVKLRQFAEVDAETQAKAIQFIYGVYWDLALEDVLGEDLAEKNVLFAEAIDIEKLAIIIAQARSIEADKDKNGKAIAGTKKRKVEQLVNSLRLTAAQKYMVMGYLGYTNANGRAQVESYIGSLQLTKTERAALLKYSGYAA